MLNVTQFMIPDRRVPHISTDITQGITLTIILMMSLLGNSLVCYYGLTSSRRKAMNYFIINLAFAEIFFALLVMPIHISQNFIGDNTIVNHGLCRIVQYFHMAMLGVMNFTLTIIAVDRYLSMFHPTSKMTIRKAKYMIALVWSIPFLVTSPLFLDLAGMRMRSRQLLLQCGIGISEDVSLQIKIYLLTQITLISILPVTLLIIMHIGMIWRILQIDASHKNLKFSQAANVKKSPCGTYREDISAAKRRAFVMNFIVTCLHVFCWGPVIILYASQIMKNFQNNKTNLLHNILTYMAESNLALNPLIYCLFDYVFQSKIICCFKHKFSLQQHKHLPKDCNKPLTEEILNELNVSKITSTVDGCMEKEPLLQKTTAQRPSQISFLSKEKLIKLVCNTRRYRSLGLSRSSQI